MTTTTTTTTPPALRLGDDDTGVHEGAAERQPLLPSLPPQPSSVPRANATRQEGEGDTAAASSRSAQVLVADEDDDAPLTHVAGADVVLQDVAVVGAPARWRHCLSLCTRAASETQSVQFVCQPTNALWHAGRLHLVVDAQDTVGSALLALLCGRRACSAGAVHVNGASASTRTLRRAVCSVTDSRGVAWDDAMLWPHMDVEQSLVLWHDLCASVSSAATRAGGRARRARAMAAFAQLPPHCLVRDLSAAERLRLQIAMQLMRDCPVLVVQYCFATLDVAAARACVRLLHAITTTLHKTVVVVTRALPPHIVRCAETVLLYGCGGHVLYSGLVRDLVAYLPRLPIAAPAAHDQTDASYLTSIADTTIITTITTTSSQLAAARGAAPVRGGLDVDTARPAATTRSSAAPSSAPSAHGLSGTGHETRPPRHGRGSLVRSVEDLCDEVAVWSEVRSLFCAAVFYDSADYARLLRRVGRHVHPTALALRLDTPGSEAAAQALVHENRNAVPRAVCKPFALLRYDLRTVRANTALLRETAGLGLGAACLACVLGSQPHNQGDMYSVRGSLFVVFALVLLLHTIATGDMVAQLHRYRAQHGAGGAFGVPSFAVYLLLRVVLVRLCQLVVLVPAVLLVRDLTWHLLLCVYTVSVVHTLLLYAVAALAMSSVQLIRWCSWVYLAYNLVCSGFLLNLRYVPHVVSYGSVLRWGYGGALHERLAGRPWICDGADGSSYCSTGDDYLALQGFARETMGRTLCVLGGMSVALLLVLTCTLYYRTHL